MSDGSSLTLAQQGFDAWRRGDFEALEQMFAPDVEWRRFEPGDWDCHNRDEVLRTLRQPHAVGFAEGRLNFHDAGPEMVVVTAHPSEIGGPEWPDETSAVIPIPRGQGSLDAGLPHGGRSARRRILKLPGTGLCTRDRPR